MHTDITSKEKPTGGGNPSADHADTGTVAHREDADKAFQTLCNAFAQHGHRLHSMTALGGNTTYWAERWGLVRYLPSLHDVAMFLAQIGGRL